MKRIAIFVSGSGTNMVNLIKKIQAGEVECDPAVVICDKPEAPAIKKARDLGVHVELVDRKKFASKAEHEAKIREIIDAKQVDYLLLAGFMRILSPEFVKHYEGRIINIHPSLLPNFPGGTAIKDAFEAKVKETGVTTHFVIAEVDAGPIILQRKVAILPSDTLESLEAKVHAAEYELYPETLRLLLSNQAKF